jgi:hypothetical protein
VAERDEEVAPPAAELWQSWKSTFAVTKVPLPMDTQPPFPLLLPEATVRLSIST